MQILISWLPCWASWDLRCFNLEIISYEKELWVKKCISFNMVLLVSSQNPVKKWSWQMAHILEVSEKENVTQMKSNLLAICIYQNFGDVRMLIYWVWMWTCIWILIKVSIVCRLKKMHNLKVENCFIWQQNWGLKPKTQYLRWLWVTAPRGKGGARVYSSFCNKDQVVGTWSDYCWLEETRYLKLKNLVLFFVWKDARVWTHWNYSFDMHFSYLRLVSMLSHP